MIVVIVVASKIVVNYYIQPLLLLSLPDDSSL